MLQALPLSAWADVQTGWSRDGMPRWVWRGASVLPAPGWN